MTHLPNLFSFARLALAPYIFLLLWRHDYRTVLVLFAIAGITDGLDGFLARRLGAGSRFGAYLDPVADKVLLSGTVLVLALTGAIEGWVAAIVIGRDVLILLFAGVFMMRAQRNAAATLREYRADAAASCALLGNRARRNFAPSAWGKASTVVQIAFVLAVVAGLGNSFVVVLKALTVALTAWSGIDYAKRAATA